MLQSFSRKSIQRKKRYLFFTNGSLRKALIFILIFSLFQVHTILIGSMIGLKNGNVFSKTNSDDIPGQKLRISQTIKGSVDATTKPTTVYAISLTAGQQVQITIKGEEQGERDEDVRRETRPHDWDGTVSILSPSSQNLVDDSSYEVIASSELFFGRLPDNYYRKFQTETILLYTPATSETYYLWVQSTKGNIAYTMELTGVVVPVSSGQTNLIIGIIIIIFGIVLLLLKKKKRVSISRSENNTNLPHSFPVYPEQKRFCSECGHPMEASEIFCSECGTKRE